MPIHKHTIVFNAYFKAMIRSSWRNKSNRFLNSPGLRISIACTGLIYMRVEDEISYVNMSAKRDRLYKVPQNQKYDAFVSTHGSWPALTAPPMQAGIPGVVATYRNPKGTTSPLFTTGDKPVYATGLYAAPSKFTMFTLPLVQGSTRRAFSQLHSAVFTVTAERKFFNMVENVIGKAVRVDNKQHYVASGMVGNMPGTPACNSSR